MSLARATPESQSPMTRPTRVASYRVGSSHAPIVSRGTAARDTIGANYAPNPHSGPVRFGYALYPANVRPEAALRRRRPSQNQTNHRTADLAGWQMGRVHSPD